MDAREILDITIKRFSLKASDLAQASGVTVQMLSRYRNQHQDMQSLNFIEVFRALPPEAQDFYIECLRQNGVTDNFKSNQYSDPINLDKSSEVDLSKLVNLLARLATDVNVVCEKLGVPPQELQIYESVADSIGKKLGLSPLKPYKDNIAESMAKKARLPSLGRYRDTVAESATKKMGLSPSQHYRDTVAESALKRIGLTQAHQDQDLNEPDEISTDTSNSKSD